MTHNITIHIIMIMTIITTYCDINLQYIRQAKPGSVREHGVREQTSALGDFNHTVYPFFESGTVFLERCLVCS